MSWISGWAIAANATHLDSAGQNSTVFQLKAEPDLICSLFFSSSASSANSSPSNNRLATVERHDMRSYGRVFSNPMCGETTS